MILSQHVIGQIEEDKIYSIKLFLLHCCTTPWPHMVGLKIHFNVSHLGIRNWNNPSQSTVDT